MARIILHIDLNAFFVRAEEIRNPFLIGKPVAIGNDGRKGIVSTCSYKAREYEIHSGMPMFQAKMLCKNLIIIPCDFKYYNLLSKEFIHHIQLFTPYVEQASIDECYADVTETYKKYGNNDILGYLKNIQDTLKEKTGLYCSIGVGSTKFIAKMGSDIKKPLGITIIRNKDIDKIIFPLPIKSYFGIGNKTYPKLKEIGINTIGDLYYCLKNNQKEKELDEILGKFKEDIIFCLEGKSSSNLDLGEFNPKSIGRTETFDEDSSSLNYITRVILALFDEIIFEMKEKKKLTKTIQLTYKTGGHECDFKTKTYAKTLNEYSDDSEFLKGEVKKFVSETYKGELLRMAGVSFKNLIDKTKQVVQMTFENYSKYEEENKALLLTQKLNRDAKKELFYLGSDIKKRRDDGIK